MTVPSALALVSTCLTIFVTLSSYPMALLMSLRQLRAAVTRIEADVDGLTVLVTVILAVVFLVLFLLLLPFFV